MKQKLFTLFAALLSVVTVFAQAPEKMNYQGVARDNSGNVLPNQAVGLQVKLRSGSVGGTVVYSETFAVSTNAFGLFNVQIGTGSNQTGTFSTIAWESNSYYVEVLMDATGGITYTSMGTQQLISVPYALYAKSSGTSGATGPTGLTGATGPTGAANANGTTNYVSKFTAATTLGNSQLFDNGTQVGIGTATPNNAFKVDINAAGTSFPLRLESLSDPMISVAEAGTSKFFLQDYNDEVWFSSYGLEPLHLGTNSAQRLTITADGNVGIGITYPTYKFQVNATGSEIARFGSTADSKWIALYQGTTRKGMLWSSTDDIILRSEASAGNMRFQTNGNNNRMTIDAAGNVGIGTITPAQLFQINGTTSMGDNLGSSVIYGNLTTPSVALNVVGNTTGAPGGADRTRTLIGGKSYIQPGITEGLDYYYGVWGHAYSTGVGYGLVASYGATPNTPTNSVFLASYNFAASFNGDVGFKTQNPIRNIHLIHDQFTGSGNTGGLEIQQTSTSNRWTLYTSQSTDQFTLWYNDAQRGNFDDVTGAYAAVSDIRLKKNIEPLPAMMGKIMQLNPTRYHFNQQADTEGKNFGLIAQELEKVFPEVVKIMGDDTNGKGIADLHTVSYSELIPVMIKGMQEQQQVIEKQNKEMEELKKGIEELKSKVK